ncbi:MAG: OmpA family protein [Bdellovibrionales bacterium]|jgi:peptidoglycan-associated lipoprotein|nr:OmpA family protein [Bdellovibrionales bacterium]MBT3525849.1 OmpA family protein [Bdellovibrionales bacterium]MBT7669186.1 OmpA family protein [Bdellovibrionales bacterium]MBT7766418.1 OmpA family protein [Bdellovibrionales bacterium]
MSRINFSLAIMLVLVLTLVGCASNKKKSGAEGDTPVIAASDPAVGAGMNFELSGDSDSGNAGGFQTLYFGYNSSEIGAEARDTLNANGQLLKDNKNLEIQIEGHCDERGGVQFNLALGERRAKSVRDYLLALGISPTRITTISFGKERLIAFGHSESFWSQNRRANFVITSK